MRIAIIDTVNQDIGLKIIFPEATYYIDHIEICNQNSRALSYAKYNFAPKLDWSEINDSNYDYVFIILASYNIIPTTPYYQESIKNIFDNVINIIDNNNFKFVGLFDNYDFDYDPNDFINNNKINLFFKRNYNKNKQYNSNVVPFPFIMFGDKSLIEKCDSELVSEEEYFKQKKTQCFFSGCNTSEYFYNYEKDSNVIRDRKYFLDRISHCLYNPGSMNYENFINQLRNSKFSLDLLGAGDPNKRTFEIILSGSLMISQYSNLLWPFENDDAFSIETIFKNENDFFNKINELMQDDKLYLKCLKNQYNIAKKYCNKNWIRLYILSKM